MNEELTKFAEGLKGAELTASEYLELGDLIISHGEVLAFVLVALFVGIILGVIIVNN